MAEILRDGDTVSLRYERFLPDANAEDVWQAITDESRLRKWFMPTTLEPRVGGATRSDGGKHGEARGTVTVWEPPKVLRYTWQWFRPDGEAAESGTYVQWELSDVPEGCSIVFTHSRLDPDWTVDYGAGWHGFLDKLVDHSLDAGEVEETVKPAYEKLLS